MRRRLTWWWTRHRARHHLWVTSQAYFHDPSEANRLAHRRALVYADHIEAARP